MVVEVRETARDRRASLVPLLPSRRALSTPARADETLSSSRRSTARRCCRSASPPTRITARCGRPSPRTRPTSARTSSPSSSSRRRPSRRARRERRRRHERARARRRSECSSRRNLLQLLVVHHSLALSSSLSLSVVAGTESEMRRRTSFAACVCERARRQGEKAGARRVYQERAGLRARMTASPCPQAGASARAGITKHH